MKAHFAKTRLLGISLMLVTVLNANAYEYQVKRGDTFSEVLERLIRGPVWGKNGSFYRAVVQNPQIKNPDRISPHQIIRIEDSEPRPTLTKIVPEAPAETQTSIPEKNDRATYSDSASHFQRTSRYEITPAYSISNFDVTDRQTGSQSNIVSNFNLSIDVSSLKKWSEKFQSFLHAHFGLIVLQPPSSVLNTLSGGTQFISGLGIGGNFKITPDLTFSLTADDEKELFVRATSTTSVTADSVSLINFGSRLSYNFIHLDPFNLGSSLELKGFLPATTDNFTTRFNTQLGCIIYLAQEEEKNMNFNTELGFTIKNMNTSITIQRETSLTLALRFHLYPTKKQTESRGVD